MVLTQVEGKIRITWGTFPHTKPLSREGCVCVGKVLSVRHC